MTRRIDMNDIVGSHDIGFVTLDTLRFDVAQQAHAAGETPFFSSLLPGEGWEERHSPGSFTYAAHHAFFAGFLPTPADDPKAPRRFAAKFAGSETTAAETAVFDAPDIVTGLRDAGYHTICIGGVGFFNKLTPLSRVLPSLFCESHWDETLGVANPHSTDNQVALALQLIADAHPDKRIFLFLNVSAIHQPNRHYLPGAEEDNVATQRAALGYVDQAIAPLFAALQSRAPTFAIICSDHGTAYGEDGMTGHRFAHPVIWSVPYLEAVLPLEAG